MKNCEEGHRSLDFSNGCCQGLDFSNGLRPKLEAAGKRRVVTITAQGAALHGACSGGEFTPTRGRSGMAGECLNLRAREDGSGRYLVPVTMARCVAETDSRPFFTFMRDDGTPVLFLSRGDTLETLDEQTGATVTVGQLPGIPLCAVQSGEDVVVMTRGGSVTVSHDGHGDWAIGTANDSLPVLQTLTGETREFESIIPARAFAAPYSRWSGRLADADADMLTADLAEAYGDCVRQAGAAGYFTAPVTVGYSMAGDHSLGIVTPVMAGVFQLTDALTFTVTSESGMYTGRGACVVRLRGYRLSVSVVDNPSLYSGTVDVRVSPQLHIVDSTAAVYRMLTGSNSGATLQAWMPGIPRSSDAVEQKCRRLVSSAVAGLAATTSSMTLQGDFATGATVGEIMPGENLSVAEERSMLQSMTTTEAADTLPTGDRWRAATVRQSGDTVVWGDITAPPISPSPLPALAATTRAGSWHGCVIVTLGNGRGQVVWSGEGRDNTPDTLSPLLCYPAPGAVEMTIRLTSADGKVRRLTVPLSPSTDGRMSIYIAPSCTPMTIPPVNEDFLIPATTATDERYPGMVVTASAANPLRPLAATMVTEGAVTALAGAAKSASSLDATRSRLYLFATSGIYILSVSSTTGSVSSRRISRHGISSPAHIAETPSMVAAIAGESLLRIDGNRVTVACNGKQYTAIGYNAAYDELALIDSGGILCAVNLASGECYTSDLRPTGFYTDRRLMILLPDRLLDASCESGVGQVNVTWEGEVTTFPFRPSLADSISLELYSAEADCRIRLLGAAGADTPLPIVTLNVKGAINHPVGTRVAAPWRRRLTVRIEGSVDADTRLYGLSLGLR